MHWEFWSAGAVCSIEKSYGPQNLLVPIVVLRASKSAGAKGDVLRSAGLCTHCTHANAFPALIEIAHRATYTKLLWQYLFTAVACARERTDDSSSFMHEETSRGKSNVLIFFSNTYFAHSVQDAKKMQKSFRYDDFITCTSYFDEVKSFKSRRWNTCVIRWTCKGAFTNYVSMFLELFDPP